MTEEVKVRTDSGSKTVCEKKEVVLVYLCFSFFSVIYYLFSLFLVVYSFFKIRFGLKSCCVSIVVVGTENIQKREFVHHC